MDDVCARLSVSVRVCVRGRETCVRAHDDVLCVVVPLLPRNLKELYRPSLSSRRTRFALNNPPAETNPSIWRRSSSFRRLRESMFGSAAISTSSGSLRRHVSRVAWACARVCMYVYVCVNVCVRACVCECVRVRARVRVCVAFAECFSDVSLSCTRCFRVQCSTGTVWQRATKSATNSRTARCASLCARTLMTPCFPWRSTSPRSRRYCN